MTGHIHTITRAICRKADGSRADGKKMIKNRTSIQNEINVLLYKARELAFSRLILTYYECEGKKIFE